MNEALFVARDLPAGHPDIVAGKRFRSANQWPDGMPGLRETLVGYCDALERLVLVPACALYAPCARTCRPRISTRPLSTSRHKLRATHYVRRSRRRPDDEFGIAPHTDTSFLTLLAPNAVPGLAFRTRAGEWIDVPTIPDAFVVNGGQLLLRWTNDKFLATPHRVAVALQRRRIRSTPQPFSATRNIDCRIAAVPTSIGPDNPFEIRDDQLHRVHDRVSGTAPTTSSPPRTRPPPNNNSTRLPHRSQVS